MALMTELPGVKSEICEVRLVVLLIKLLIISDKFLGVIKSYSFY